MACLKQLKETDWQQTSTQAPSHQSVPDASMHCPFVLRSLFFDRRWPHQAAAHMTARQKAGRAIAMRIRMTLLLDEVITLLVVVFQDSNHYVIKQ